MDRIFEAYEGTWGGRILQQESRDRIDRLVEWARGPRLLDVGCSQGILPIGLKDAEGIEYVKAIDLDPEAINFAKDKLSQINITDPHIEFEVADFINLSPPEKRYDTIVMGQILEHVQEPEKFLIHAKDFLSDNGLLLVTVPFGKWDHDEHQNTFFAYDLWRIVSPLISVTEIDIVGSRIFMAAEINAVEKFKIDEVHSLDRTFFVRKEERHLEINAGYKRQAETAQSKLRNQLAKLKREIRTEKDRAASLEQRLATERAGFEDEVNVARTRMAELEEEFAKERQRFEQEMKAGKAREAALEKKIADEQTPWKVLGDKLAISRAAARNAAQRMLALENRLDQVENSIAFRLGSAIVNSAKSPRNLIRLPREIGRLQREHRSRSRTTVPSSGAMVGQEGGQPAPSASPTLSLTKGEIVALFEKGGVEALFLDIRTLNPDPAAARTALIAAAKVLAGEGYLDAEFDLTQKAVLIDDSDASLRALHWSAQRRGDFVTAWDCVRRIETLYGSDPSPAQLTYLEKLRRGPAYQLSLLDRIKPVPDRRIDSVAGRICYVLHNSLPYSSGGYATRAHGLAAGLQDQGFDVVALTRPGFPLDIKHELSAHEVPQEQGIDDVSYRRILSPQRTGQSVLHYMMAAADALTEQFFTIRPEAVIAASNHVTGLPALIAARRLGLPFFYEVRGFWEITRISREPEFEQTSSFKVQKLLEAELAKRADHVFTLTGPMRGELIERGVDPETITLLPNSCEIERFTPRARDEELAARLGIPENVPVIGYVGTFVQYEGLELLVEAAAGLREQGHEFRLLLVGNENASGQDVGPITMEINRIAAERGLDQWLILPGRVPHEEVEAYYSLIDIAPFPRKAQPVTELVSPMKPLEAYAMEKAVVVSSVGALLEMVEHEKTGLVFEKDSVASLTDALARLIADPALREQLGREGRRWVEAERTWEATAKRAAGVISQKVAASKTRASPPLAEAPSEAIGSNG